MGRQCGLRRMMMKTEIVKCKAKVKFRTVVFVGDRFTLEKFIGSPSSSRHTSRCDKVTYEELGWDVLCISSDCNPDFLRGRVIDLAFWEDEYAPKELVEEIVMRLTHSNGSRIIFEEEER
jgi:hypothetical protein